MNRLKQWCEDINKAQNKVSYDFVFVGQAGYESYKEKGFAELVRTFREYK